MQHTLEPMVYVGTYGKYNNGSINGGWLKIADYADKQEFYDAINELHADELAANGEIEPMFQDWQDIPDAWIGESWIADDAFVLFGSDSRYSDEQRSAIKAYIGTFRSTQNVDFDEILEKYKGTTDDKSAWFSVWLDETGFFESWPQTAINYFDYDSYQRDCELEGLYFVEAGQGNYFVFWG